MRQLEAIIRLSESIAKIHLSGTVEVAHVEEAHRIFKISTLNAAQSGISGSAEAPAELGQIMRKIEEAVKRRVAIGTKISYQKLQSEMMQRFENQKAIEHVSLLSLPFRRSLAWSSVMNLLTTNRGRSSSGSGDDLIVP